VRFASNLVCRFAQFRGISIANLVEFGYVTLDLFRCENYTLYHPVNILTVRCDGFLGCTCVLILLQCLVKIHNVYIILPYLITCMCILHSEMNTADIWFCHYEGTKFNLGKVRYHILV